MANASGKHHGAGVQGKGDGTGAMTDMPEGPPENAVLSNRDKQQHSDERGLGSKNVQNEHRQDHASNRQSDSEADDALAKRTMTRAPPGPSRRAAGWKLVRVSDA
jgi:hypothetical protein